MKRRVQERIEGTRRDGGPPAEVIAEDRADSPPAVPPAAAAIEGEIAGAENVAGDHNDQQDSESQAASDVAVAGIPETSSKASKREKTRKRDRTTGADNSGSSSITNKSLQSNRPQISSSLPADAHSASKPTGHDRGAPNLRRSDSSQAVAGEEDSPVAAVSSNRPYRRLTYPSPRNFAERLMGALESGLSPDCLLWTGGGKAVALHPKRLKKGNFLSSHFQVANYGAFLRNFNRWGFRRVTHFVVPDGFITYQNSLFKRDSPHLVSRMRMDSDVQAVYEQSSRDTPSVPESIEFIEQFGGQQNLEGFGSGSGLLPHQQRLVEWLNGNGWASHQAPPGFDNTTANSAQLPASLPTRQHQLAPQQQHQLPPQPDHEQLVSSLASMLVQSGFLTTSASNAPQHHSSNTGEFLFEQIIQLSQQYLNQQALSSSNNNSCVTVILQLLQILDQQMKKQSLERQISNLLEMASNNKSTSQAPSNQQPQLQPRAKRKKRSAHTSSQQPGTASSMEASQQMIQESSSIVPSQILQGATSDAVAPLMNLLTNNPDHSSSQSHSHQASSSSMALASRPEQEHEGSQHSSSAAHPQQQQPSRPQQEESQQQPQQQGMLNLLQMLLQQKQPAAPPL